MDAKTIKLVLNKHLPDILVGVGISLSILAMIENEKETEDFLVKKLDHKKLIHDIHKDKEEGKYAGLERAYKKDLSREYRTYFGEYVKCHWKSLVCEAGFITSILYANKIRANRETVAIAAGAAIKKSFDLYREGLLKREGGAEIDEDLRAGVSELYETSEFDETGKGSRKRKQKKVINKELMCDDSSFIFGPYKADGSPNPKWSANMEDNYAYVETMEEYFSHLGDTHPLVFLNQVIPYFDDSFEALTEAGQELGKVFSMRNPSETEIRFSSKDYAMRNPHDPNQFVDCLLIQTNLDTFVSKFLA